MVRPFWFVIAASNGAGELTPASRYVPTSEVPPFLNAEKIAAELSPGNADAMLPKAGRQLLGQLDTLLKRAASFILETTLSEMAFHRMLRRTQRLGHDIVAVRLG